MIAVIEFFDAESGNLDRFIEQNKPKAMYAEAGLDAAGIVAAVFAALGKGRDAAGVIRLA